MTSYKAVVSWKCDSKENFAANKYSRGHEWEFDGGITVPASSSPHSVRLPFSIEAAVDPEEALVAAASSCHMLSFLYLAAKAAFVAITYRDEAIGEMSKNDKGGLWISRITLDPVITWAEGSSPDAAELSRLHHEAHKLCYIANSIRSEILVKGAASF